MPRFAFTALDDGGRKIRGELEAGNRDSAVAQLLSKGQTPLDVFEAAGQGTWRQKLLPESKALTHRDAADFAEDVARLLGSGFSLVEALDMAAASARSKAARAIAARASHAVQKGGSLSSALLKEEGPAAESLAGLASAGETAGRLKEILSEAAKGLSASAKFREKLTSAMIYPAIILFMIVLTLFVFFSFVLPRLQPLFEDAQDLPWMTEVLLAVGGAASWLGPGILLVILITFLAFKVRPAWQASFRRFLDRLMLTRLALGAPRLSAYATWSGNLGLLVTAGVPLPEAARVSAGSVRNQYLNKSFSEMVQPLREGQDFSTLLRKDPLVPDILMRMSQVGERAGKLGPALEDASMLLQREAEMKTERIIAAMTPAITILLGVLVAFVVGALFLGVASLTDVQI